MGVKKDRVLVNFWCERDLLSVFDAVCSGRGVSRSQGLRDVIRDKTGLEIARERAALPTEFVLKDGEKRVFGDGNVPAAEPTWEEPRETDFYGKPFPPGYTRTPDTWWAEHPKRPRLWIGERDASGEPIFEEF